MPVSKHHSSQSGQAALFAVLLLATASLAIGAGFFGLAIRENASSRTFIRSLQTYAVTESGVEDALLRLVSGMSWTSELSLSLGGSTAQTAISEAAGGTQTVSTEGNSGNLVRKVQATAAVSLGSPKFFFGAQAGEGGVKLEEGTRIEGVGGVPGNIYSNGPIEGDNGATITGDVTVAAAITEDIQTQQIICNTDQVFGSADPVIDMAQSFQASQTKPFVKISLFVKKFNNPGNRTVYITGDVSNHPGTQELASGTLSSGLVTGSYGWADVTFSSPPLLTQGTTYWVVVDATKSASNYWSWCKDSGAGYASGVGKYSKSWDHDPWTQISGDLAFRTYVGSGVSTLEEVVVLGTARANTITESKICGDAYYQSIDASSLNFLNSPASPCPAPRTPGTGHASEPDSPPQNMPISQANIDQWKEDAAAGDTIIGNCGDSGVAACVIGDNGLLLLGPKKITGNLVLTKKQTLIVRGTLYIVGSISMDSGSGATIKCDPSLGAKSCIIVTDSWMHIKNNATFQGSGQQGSFLLMVSTLQGCNGGADLPQCTHHNGAVDIHNNATGAIFYVPYSLLNIHNGVTVTQATAYKLNVDNNTTIQYEQGLASPQFSSGPGGSFEITGWRETE